MIIYENIKLLPPSDFSEYLAADGLSHSYLKHQVGGIVPEMNVTDNMKMGSLIDSMLTEPEKVDFTSPFYRGARKIADKITSSQFGPLLNFFQKQLSFTADASYIQNGIKWTIKTKGRLDYCMLGKVVLDLKFTKQKDIRAVINFFGYDNQLWHYARLSKAKQAYILAYVEPLDKVDLIAIDVSQTTNNFWSNHIVDFGTPVQLKTL